MAKIERVKSKIRGLIDRANARTNREDTDLTNAVNAVISNYGLDRFKSRVEGSLEVITAEDLEGVTVIGSSAIRDCEKLKSITIPDSVKSIDDHAFSSCTALKLLDFTVCTSVPILGGTNAFENIPSSFLILVPSSLYGMWITATNWSVYADYIEIVGEHVHTYTSEVTEPTCTERGYTTYTCVRCGESYVSDYTDALGHNYEAVVTKPTRKEGGYTTYTCKVCGHSYVADYTDPIPYSEGLAYNLLDDGSYAVYDLGACTDDDIDIPYTHLGMPVTAICDDAFKGETDIVSVTIPESVTSIGMRAFLGCANLASVDIPDSVTSIGAYAFDECASLTNLTIPNGIKLYSEGLAYSGYAGGSSKWTVDGVGTCTDTDLIIPSTHEGKPVVYIQSEAFKVTDFFINRIVFPGSILSFGNDIYNRTNKIIYDFTSHTTIPQISTSTFMAEDREIRVPASLYRSWRYATNWADYAENIIAVEVKNNGNS